MATKGQAPPPQGQPPPPGQQQQGGYYYGSPPPQGQPPPGYYGPPPQQEYQKVFNGQFESYNNYPRGENDNLLGGLCYFSWFVSLIVLLAIKPLSPYLRFHAVQALGLQIVYMVAVMILVFICFPLAFVFLGYLIFIMITVMTGRDYRVPYLANYVEENYV